MVSDIERLANGILSGRMIDFEDAQTLWFSDFHELIFHAGRLRRHFKGNAVHLCSIVNAKSGACSENCRFCAQSSHHQTSTKEYPLISEKELIKAFGKAVHNGAHCFGVVTSGRNVTESELDAICAALPHLDNGQTTVSASLGELDEKAFRRLKKSGLKRYHHNIETAESFFSSVCTTHTFADRVATVKRAKDAGLDVCCGGLFGIGENFVRRLEFAFTLRNLNVDSIPLNFLNPMPGTPLANQPRLPPQEILRIIALFRFILPDKSISVCGGREVNLRDLQSWIFDAGANGMMTGGYLTTDGRSNEQDLAMIADLGLVAEKCE